MEKKKKQAETVKCLSTNFWPYSVLMLMWWFLFCVFEHHLAYFLVKSQYFSISFHLGCKQNMQGNFPSTWLTQSPISVTEPEHGISKNSKNTQNVHQVWNSSLLDPRLLSGSPVFLQDHNSSEQLRQYPNSCASGYGKFNVRVKCPNDCPSWSHLSLTNDGKSRREEKLILKQQDTSANSQGENRHMQKQRKKVNSSDTKPGEVRLHFR